MKNKETLSTADFYRMPGLYRAFEFGMIMETGRVYLIDDGASDFDGVPLYSVFVAEWPEADGET